MLRQTNMPKPPPPFHSRQQVLRRRDFRWIWQKQRSIRWQRNWRMLNMILIGQTVHAPGDGYVTNLQLREGMLVGGAGSGAVMSFVLENNDTARGVMVAAFDQKNFLRIQPGQYAEVALHGYPGQIFTGRVLNAIDVSGAGQLTASRNSSVKMLEAIGLPLFTARAGCGLTTAKIYDYPAAHRRRSPSIPGIARSLEFP